MTLRPDLSVLDPAAVIARVACTSNEVNSTSVASRSAAQPTTATSPNRFIHTARQLFASATTCNSNDFAASYGLSTAGHRTTPG